MRLTTMKSKKLLVGLLSTAITFKCLYTYQSLAMVTNTNNTDSAATVTATCSTPTINAIDKERTASLLNVAAKEHDPIKFKELLEKTTSLDTLYEQQFQTESGTVTKNQNIMEALASLLTYRYLGYHYGFKEESNKNVDDYMSCATILLDHCVKHNIQIHVNPEQFSPKKVGESNLWQTSLFRVFDHYMFEYPNLFSREYDDDEIGIAYIDYTAFQEEPKLKLDVSKFRSLLKKYPEQMSRDETKLDYFYRFFRYLEEHPELTASV